MTTTSTTTTTERLSLQEKVGYALGDTASNLFWMTFVFFGSMFYTDVFGLDPMAMALLFGITRVWDAVNDPLMGMIADRTESRWGKFRPYMRWLAVPFGVCGTLAFVTPPFGDYGKLVWAFVTYTLIGMVYTGINLPYSALMGVISPSSEERTKVSTARFVGAYSGGMIVSLCTLPLVGLIGRGNQQFGFAVTAGLYAGVGVLMWFVAFYTTKERVKPPADQQSSFVRDLGDVLTNVPWLVLFLLGIFTLGYVSIRNGAVAYYFKYFVGNQHVLGMDLTPTAMISAFFLVGSIATLFGTSITAPIARIVGKRTLYMILMALATVLTISFYFLRPQDVVLMFVLQILCNLLMGPTAALVFAMYADASDYSEWKTGRRSTGLVFAASSFAQKMGWTIGGIVTGFVLAGFGYKANEAQPPGALEGLKLLISIVPAVGSVAATLLPFAYSLSDKRMAVIGAELAARREGRAPVPTGDATRDTFGQVLGILIGLVALAFIVRLVFFAITKAMEGDWLYVGYIAVIVTLFAAAILWIRRADQRSRARLPLPSGG